VRLPRRPSRRLVALAAVALVGLGGVVALTRPSGSRTSPLDVRAAGDAGRRAVGDPLPDPDASSTSSTAAGSSSSSPATTAPPVTAVPKVPRATTSSAPTTTTTTLACAAPNPPVYAFSLFRRPDGNGWVAGGNPALQRSTDGGQAWTPACLPAAVITGPGVLRGIAFAADGQHGWVVGDRKSVV